MSDDDFLRRWSRRKQEVQRAAKVPPAAKAESGAPEPAPTEEAAKPPQPAFDPASLPSLESITAVSDISPFLRAGVPAELTRAALRRVWTADPAIRDFVGLSENAWDFTAPNAIPGFGSLELTEDVRAMIASTVEQIGAALEPRPPNAPVKEAKAKDSSALNSDVTSADAPLPSLGDARLANEPSPLQSNEEIAVVQHDVRRGDEDEKPLPRRGHGGALPR